MKFPVSVYFDNTGFPVHGIFNFLAFFIAFRYFICLRKKQQYPIALNELHHFQYQISVRAIN